jgi:hypothetical protein
MDHTERQIIDDLFGKLRQAESQSGPRDPEAENHIRDLVARQPAAPYLMAQAIVMQEQALASLQARIEDMERQLAERPAAGGGGLFGALFGGGAKPAPQRPQPHGYQQPGLQPGAGRQGPWGHQAAPGYGDPRVAAYANPYQRQGGGFMAGALQTAMGVAGGVLIGNALASAFSGGDATAAEPAADTASDASADAGQDPGADYQQASWDEGGGDFGDEI